MSDDMERRPTAWDNPPDTPVQMIITGRWTQSPGALDRLTKTLDDLIADADGYLTDKKSGGSIPPGAARLEAVLLHVANLSETLKEKINVKRHVSLQKASIGFPLGEAIRPQFIDYLEMEARKVLEYLRKERLNPNLDLLPTFVQFDNYLSDWRGSFLNPVLDEVAKLRSDKDGYTISTRPALQETMLSRQTERLNELEYQARRTVGNIRSAGNEAGSERLASTFADVGKTEVDRARFWTQCVFVCLLAGVALPIVIFSFDVGLLKQATGIAGLVVKALTGLPFFAGAAYCARIAAQHRETARHMTILTAQIDSIRAYSSELPKDTQNELITMLGKHAFSSLEFSNIDAGSLSVVPESVLSVVEKALDVAKDTVKKND